MSSEDSFNIQSTIDSVKKSVDDVIAQASSTFDSGVRTVSKSIFNGLNVAADVKNDASSELKVYAGEAEKYVSAGVEKYNELENIAVSQLKAGIKWSIDNPEISYSVLGVTTILALPATRWLLYRATIGRFQNAENIFNSNIAKLESVKSNSEKFALEITKLEERRISAEAEFKNSIAKLKATRDEFQRLASQVSKNQKAAASVVEELRGLKQFENSAQARSEAATKLSDLKKAASSISKSIYRINVKDI
uniref:Uncharacterized protein n=1 Tax=Polytomella parva TaxID=51329 RepID=A0A6U0XHU4_9CHLO|mmetsp:Transcript_32230/g.58601  ORF Transcript_32230/g.58601 Transcript_32230/m.58601 type:complete len:250 (-) Transcript_32230:53-802(-)|eukprot:CAMPEP_0175082940 /NCGR_PEP_ID=MMETSP0052_2-20121109/27049_1 /TAXON_ID=51329 ORGANISM="Polytomella parva, Strain SAG 63-3" /NCGR_SAMPLE_ID=MMETSP0052_2 /ASSEMBLY_ACC=CAM_ASM_000194 /LENGTH=249 /DNA_ID=CAMNT_0016354221 /DNA_START=36 /DNA_END=785 /DNA_ORIENTATION=+